MPAPVPPLLAQRLRALHVLWLAQLGSVAIFAVVCSTVARSGSGADPEVTAAVRPYLWAAGAGVGLLSLWWRRLVTTATDGRFALLRLAPGAPLDDPVALAAFARVQTNCVVVWALSEAVAIVGLVLALLSGQVGEFMPFAVAAVSLLYAHRPAAWPLEQIFGRAEDDSR